MVMTTISISDFKRNCGRFIDQVNKTREPLRITRHGRPVAELVPVGPERKGKFIGAMVGTGEIVGDIVSPIINLKNFEACRG